MRGSLRIVLFKWFAWSIAARLHTEEDQSPSSWKNWSRLPRGLIRDFKTEIRLVASIDIDPRGFALCCVEQLRFRFGGAQSFDGQAGRACANHEADSQGYPATVE